MKNAIRLAILFIVISCQSKTTNTQVGKTVDSFLPDSLNGNEYLCLGTRKFQKWKPQIGINFTEIENISNTVEGDTFIKKITTSRDSIVLLWGAVTSGSTSYLPDFSIHGDTILLKVYNILGVKENYSENGKVYEREYIKEESFHKYRIAIDKKKINCRFVKFARYIVKIN